MKYQRQHELQAELDSRIPRGPRGSLQNQFRQAVWFFTSQPRFTFEEGLELALRSVRLHEPDFVPVIRSGA